MYSKKVLEYIRNPRNAGSLENPDGVGKAVSAARSVIMELYIKVDDDVITNASFRTFGCGAAIAASSMVTEIIKGKAIPDVLKISNADILEALGGLPQEKMHCSFLAEEVIRSAIDNYRSRDI